MSWLLKPSAASNTMPARRANLTSAGFDYASLTNFDRCASSNSITLACLITTYKIHNLEPAIGI
jgi:hypothetical protein